MEDGIIYKQLFLAVSSMPLLPKKICETLTMDFDSLIENKSGLGTAGIVVINKDQDIISCMARIARFL